MAVVADGFGEKEIWMVAANRLQIAAECRSQKRRRHELDSRQSSRLEPQPAILRGNKTWFKVNLDKNIFFAELSRYFK